MKQSLLLVFIVVLSSSSSSFAQSDGLLISENFPYATGNLSGQGSPAWTSSGGTGDVNVISLSNNTGALVYPGYLSGTSYITTDDGDTKDPYKGFLGSQTVSTANATSFFMSFVVRVSSSNNTSPTFFASPSVALRNSAGNNVCFFYAADNGGFGTQSLKLGISKTGGAGNGDYASANFAFNTTYLVVIRYDIVTGGNSNDRMYMWVNPSLVSEPAIGSASESITSGSDGNATGSITGLQILQDNFFDGTTASFDAFKLAYASGYSSSPSNPNVAWADLSPVGAPLPVKFGALKVFQQGSDVQLDWSSFSEENVDIYEIERSADGENFEKIGELAAAGNSNSKLDYTWLDESPLDAVNFYRIRSVDFDGKLTYSLVQKISMDIDGLAKMSLYPNPVKGSIVSLQLVNLKKGNYEVMVFDVMGHQVLNSKLVHNGGSSTQTLQLPASLKPGMYRVRVSNAFSRYQQPLIIK